MRNIAALELEPRDFETSEKRDQTIRAMGQAELVVYRGEVVKNRNGKITRRLSDLHAQERRKGERVY